MSFTYKLARRLALAHVAVLGLVLLACNDAVDPSLETPDNHSAFAPNLRLGPANTKQITQQGSPPAGCGNEPSGYRLLSYEDFSITLPRAPAKANAQGWLVYPGGYSPQNLVQNGGVITGTFPRGLKAGTGAWNASVKFRAVHDVYVCTRMNLQAGLRVPNPLLKFIYFLGPGGLHNTPMSQPFPQIALSGNKPGEDKVCTGSPVNLRDGLWHRIEYAVRSGTLHQSNASIDVWLDGVNVCHATGLRWWTSLSKTEQITEVRWNPNSAGGAPVKDRQGNPIPGSVGQPWRVPGTMAFDDMYISGR